MVRRKSISQAIHFPSRGALGLGTFYNSRDVTQLCVQRCKYIFRNRLHCCILKNQLCDEIPTGQASATLVVTNKEVYPPAGCIWTQGTTLQMQKSPLLDLSLGCLWTFDYIQDKETSLERGRNQFRRRGLLLYFMTQREIFGKREMV